MPYVKERGNAGDLVTENQTIYATKACMTITRKSKKQIEEEKKKQKKLESISWANAEQNIKPTTSVKIGSGIASTKIEVPTAIAEGSAEAQRKESISQASTEAVVGGATQTPSDKGVIPQPVEEEIEKMKTEKLGKATAFLESITYQGVVMDDLGAWCDMLLEYLENLPDMDELTDFVYEVQQNDADEWVYTGHVEEQDNAVNKKINETKRWCCARLTILMDDVTKTMTAKLEDLLTRVEKTGPFMKVISIIQSVPSLTTIIDWAKGIIKFLFAFYELIYGVFKMAMDLLELIIIKFPQVISKISSVITKFDCHLEQARPVTVKINLKKSEKNSSDKEGKTVRKKK